MSFIQQRVASFEEQERVVMAVFKLWTLLIPFNPRRNSACLVLCSYLCLYFTDRRLVIHLRFQWQNNESDWNHLAPGTVSVAVRLHGFLHSILKQGI